MMYASWYLTDYFLNPLIVAHLSCITIAFKEVIYRAINGFLDSDLSKKGSYAFPCIWFLWTSMSHFDAPWVVIMNKHWLYPSWEPMSSLMRIWNNAKLKETLKAWQGISIPSTTKCTTFFIAEDQFFDLAYVNFIIKVFNFFCEFRRSTETPPSLFWDGRESLSGSVLCLL